MEVMLGKIQVTQKSITASYIGIEQKKIRTWQISGGLAIETLGTVGIVHNPGSLTV